MPLHDWSKVEAGIFHAFHLAWIIEIQNELNDHCLPSGFYALAEQHIGGYIADVLALQTTASSNAVFQSQTEYEVSAGTAVVQALPSTKIHESIPFEPKDLRRTLAIRHVSSHRIVAIIEIVSPSNKDRKEHVAMFVQKTVDAITRSIHVLLIDLFAPGRHDPWGLHYQIREMMAPNMPNTENGPFRSTLASYQAGPKSIEIFIEHVEPNSEFPDMPLFLDAPRYIHVPLEATYLKAWQGMPAFWCNVITGEIP